MCGKLAKNIEIVLVQHVERREAELDRRFSLRFLSIEDIIFLLYIDNILFFLSSRTNSS